MKQQAKTLETTLREKIATGYDPVTLNVAVRAVNEENIEVSIEGQKYSVRGNTVSEVHGRGTFTAPAEAVVEAVLPEDGNTNSPASEPDDVDGTDDAGVVDPGSPDDDTGAVLTARLEKVAEKFAADEMQPSDQDDAGVTIFHVIKDGAIIGTGTLTELENWPSEGTSTAAE